MPPPSDGSALILTCTLCTRILLFKIVFPSGNSMLVRYDPANRVIFLLIVCGIKLLSPLGPVFPGVPCSPLGPAAPVWPRSPFSPLSPLFPFKPRSPRSPWGPLSPRSPRGPCSPLSPLGPVLLYPLALICHPWGLQTF